jgi:serine/threonine-protein kinase
MLVVLVAIIFWVLNLQPSTLTDNTTLVPEVAGATYESGAETLTAEELVPLRVDQESDTIEAGKIIETDPPSGATVAIGETIRVIVSTGKAPVTVPKLAGVLEADARATITELELVAGETTAANSPTVPKGVVISTVPEGGTVALKGDSVDFVVSTGLVNIESYIGSRLQDALTRLQSPELQLTPQPVADPSCPTTDGNLVTQQSIGPGDVPQGSTIVLTYCFG